MGCHGRRKRLLRLSNVWKNTLIKSKQPSKMRNALPVSLHKQRRLERRLCWSLPGRFLQSRVPIVVLAWRYPECSDQKFAKTRCGRGFALTKPWVTKVAPTGIQLQDWGCGCVSSRYRCRPLTSALEANCHRALLGIEDFLPSPAASCDQSKQSTFNGSVKVEATGQRRKQATGGGNIFFM